MDIVCIAFALPVLLLGAAFLRGRALACSRAWKAVPESEKAAVNVDRVNRNLGCAVLFCGTILLACGICAEMRSALGPLFTIWALAAIGDAIYISKSKRYVNSGIAPTR